LSFGSRAKGSKAEIEVAKKLEAWWGQVEPGCKFVRTPLSGGWGKPEHRAGFQASGDLMTTAAQWPWAVEVKRRETFSWKTLLAGRASPVWGWWRQAQVAAEEMSKEPLLLFRKNREPWHVMVTLTHCLAYGGWMSSAWLTIDANPAHTGGRVPVLVPGSEFFESSPRMWLSRPVTVSANQT